ncbi:MAG: type I glyceraldehyde-3-phosphate dehydrogenase [Deltaproteobacteria bacterium RIFOXYA12_FULL_58_15]|nr:MAG: type I glyceraldehyde-3-phosphate dehydrogenase [Deltaproteobacteria bacterium RIFOXYA12_FULL_58_15]OGR07259.1 MAG: type I glyceraldehyde-3-phosphate dehydrogenase [Deltaproteobacteria bacterium RIFOXYB12_FULL_58_9]
MAVTVGINGFGRIGRLVFRAMMEKGGYEVAGINDLADADMLAHMLKYDSSQGRYPGKVEAKDNMLVVDGKAIKVFSEKDPAKLPWGQLGVRVAVEATGVFRDNKKDGKPGYDSHLDAGAKKVVISAPTKGDATLVVLGVNDGVLTAANKCVSNASCTTNSLAPVVKVLDEAIGIHHGLMVTCHGYTADQKIVDLLHKDKRRSRAAAVNIIPTTTGAAAAVGKVYPKLAGKLDGYALRVPVVTGSITDLTVLLKKAATAEEINSIIKKAAEGSMKGYLEYTEDPIVSSDIIHNSHSSIFDAGNTKVMEGTMAKITMWYDNEWGYSCRTAELVTKLANL